MELLTKAEVEALTGLSERDFETYLKKYHRFFPVTVTPAMNRNGLFPKDNLSFLLMLVELTRTGEYTDSQLSAICERVARSRKRGKQMVAVEKPSRPVIDEVMDKLDMLLYGNSVLKKSSDGLKTDNAELKKKNEHMQKTLDRILAERKNLVRILTEKEEKNRQLSKKITHLAGTVLKLKRENQDLKQCKQALEARLSETDGTAEKSLIQSLEKKLSDFERKHSNLVSRLATVPAEGPVYRKPAAPGMWSRISRWFRQQSFENKYSL